MTPRLSSCYNAESGSSTLHCRLLQHAHFVNVLIVFKTAVYCVYFADIADEAQSDLPAFRPSESRTTTPSSGKVCMAGEISSNTIFVLFFKGHYECRNQPQEQEYLGWFSASCSTTMACPFTPFVVSTLVFTNRVGETPTNQHPCLLASYGCPFAKKGVPDNSRIFTCNK